MKFNKGKYEEIEELKKDILYEIVFSKFTEKICAGMFNEVNYFKTLDLVAQRLHKDNKHYYSLSAAEKEVVFNECINYIIERGDFSVNYEY